MIDRQHGKIVVECDSCDAVLETETADFSEAREMMIHIEVTGPWSAREVETAARMWQSLYADEYDDGPAPRGVKPRVIRAIAHRLNRLYGNVEMRLVHHGPSFNAGLSAVIASPHALADRERREAARCNLSLIGNLMNDPPPGFSALDRKRQATCA